MDSEPLHVLRVEHGEAYAAVVSEAARLYARLDTATTNPDPFWTSGPEIRLRDVFYLQGMRLAAIAILRAAPHNLTFDRANAQAQNHIRDMARAVTPDGKE